jgi:hypothetical protein
MRSASFTASGLRGAPFFCWPNRALYTTRGEHPVDGEPSASPADHESDDAHGGRARKGEEGDYHEIHGRHSFVLRRAASSITIELA